MSNPEQHQPSSVIASPVIASQQQAEQGLAGGKAKALAILTAAGVGRIPPFVALLPQPELNVQTLSIQTLSIQTGVSGPSPAVVAAIPDALASLGSGPDAAYAVRSSALDEDGAEHSFAGQLSSYLNVPADEVLARVAQVWLSGLSGHVLAYRKARGLDTNNPPAVVIMPMIKAKFAGVAFSADPVTGERNLTVISAVAGLGESLVSGEETGETYRVKAGKITGDSALLTAAQITEITALAHACQAHFGVPQDIEWAIDETGLWLLQSRPITTLNTANLNMANLNMANLNMATLNTLNLTGALGKEFTYPNDPITWWDNSNIVESYSGVTTPLTFSFARRAYGAVYRRLLSLLGVSDAEIMANGSVLDSMIGLYRGRIYYNLNHWYKVLSLLPGFNISRKFMETMMGVAEGMPDDLQVKSSRGKTEDALHLARTAMGLVRSHQKLPNTRNAFLQRLEKVLQPPTPPLAQRSLSGLVAHYRDLESQLLHRWDAPLVNDFMAMVHYGVLKQLCVNWLDDTHGTLQNALITATGGMVSAEPAERLRELADLIPDDILSILEQGSLAEIEAALPPHAFTGGRSYLQKFGERTNDELKLESRTLHDDPTPLWRAVARQKRHGGQEHNGAGKRENAEELALAKLRPMQRPVFMWALKHARDKVRDRENLRLERTRVFGRARSILRASGERLAEAGVLDHADDVFYLEVEEVLGYAEGTSSTVDLRAIAAIRRAEFEGFKQEATPPRRFSAKGALNLAQIVASESAKPLLGEDTRMGIGCSAGVIRGPVRVVHDPSTVQLDEPAILVAERTDPGWILILNMARALIVERGSLLSHSAIVSRELGIPAVVAVDGVMDWLKDGDIVELDGQTGIIRKIAKPKREEWE